MRFLLFRSFDGDLLWVAEAKILIALIVYGAPLYAVTVRVPVPKWEDMA